jgi:hypothetical protein
MNAVLAYLSAALLAVWGTAHAIPTGQILAGFKPVTADNRRVIQQEWLAEAFTMWGLAAVVVAASAAGGAMTDTRAWVYRAVSALLIALAGLTTLTGARTPAIWFKICPVLLTAVAALLMIASF